MQRASNISERRFAQHHHIDIAVRLGLPSGHGPIDERKPEAIYDGRKRTSKYICQAGSLAQNASELLENGARSIGRVKHLPAGFAPDQQAEFRQCTQLPVQRPS